VERDPGDDDGMMAPRRRTTLASAVAALAFAPTGCGERTVDATQVEQQIEQQLSTATTKVTSVSCPDDVKSQTGAKFTCSAKLSGGGSADVQVTETQAPDHFTYSFKPGTVKISGASVDQALEQDLGANGFPNATVNCPSPIPVKPGTTTTCPVSGARGGVGTVSFQFSDASGSVEESSVETGS
jgi:Domain of unknown function (DUF4333)